jgi:hypothetical protein
MREAGSQKTVAAIDYQDILYRSSSWHGAFSFSPSLRNHRSRMIGKPFKWFLRA